MELKVTDFYDYFKVLSKNSRKHLRKSCYMLLVFFFSFFAKDESFCRWDDISVSSLLYISGLSIADLNGI